MLLLILNLESKGGKNCILEHRAGHRSLLTLFETRTKSFQPAANPKASLLLQGKGLPADGINYRHHHPTPPPLKSAVTFIFLKVRPPEDDPTVGVNDYRGPVTSGPSADL